MFGSLGNLANLLKQAQNVRKHMEQVQKELAEKRFEGSAGGGVVTVTVDGSGRVVGVRIDESLLRPEEKEMLEDMLVAAANAAAEKAKEALKEQMAAITGGLDLSAIEGLLGGQK